jgi:hypothetical protein
MLSLNVPILSSHDQGGSVKDDAYVPLDMQDVEELLRLVEEEIAATKSWSNASVALVTLREKLQVAKMWLS